MVTTKILENFSEPGIYFSFLITPVPVNGKAPKRNAPPDILPQPATKHARQFLNSLCSKHITDFLIQ